MIIGVRKPDWGGIEVIDNRDPDVPVYLNQDLPEFRLMQDIKDIRDISDEVITFIDGVIAQRQAAKVDSDKRAAVDAAVQAELAKRMASVDYGKSAEEAVATVFPATEARP